MGATVSLLKEEQLEMSPTIQALYEAKAERIRDLHRRAITINAMSLTHLARVTGIDNSQITRMLDGRANLAPAFTAAVMDLDEHAVLIAGLADMVKRDVIERRPDPVAENKQLRSTILAMRDELDRLLGTRGQP